MTNPKVVRASASAILRTPWLTVSREDAPAMIASFHRPVYRLEIRDGAFLPDTIRPEPCVLIAGSEGSGITLPVPGTSIYIPHAAALESLNVGVATSIILYERSRQLAV